jgi:hypothetical protein
MMSLQNKGRPYDMNGFLTTYMPELVFEPEGISVG